MSTNKTTLYVGILVPILEDRCSQLLITIQVHNIQDIYTKGNCGKTREVQE